MPTLVLLIFSVQTLLASYTLVTQAEMLVRESLNTEETIQPAGILGEQLLAPAFASPDLAKYADAGVGKERLAMVLRSLPTDEYRNRFKTLIVDPDRITLERESASKRAEAVVPKADKGGAKAGAESKADPAASDAPSIVVSTRPELTTAVLVQMALRWLMDVNREWPQLAPKGDAPPVSKDPVPLPEFIVSLVGEIQDGVVLDRLDWEHVAGHRFSAAVMQPVLVKYVTRTAITGAVLVMVINGFYFFGFYRIRRWMARKRALAGAKPQAGASDARQSPPH
jgi:hypothetical protein